MSEPDEDAPAVAAWLAGKPLVELQTLSALVAGGIAAGETAEAAGQCGAASLVADEDGWSLILTVEAGEVP